MPKEETTKTVIKHYQNRSFSYVHYILFLLLQYFSLWRSYGVNVSVTLSDATTLTGAKLLIGDAIKFAPVGGIFNLAVLLRDGMIQNQEANDFKEVMASKARATIYLDEVSRRMCPRLEHFVVFSSISCGRGNAGQSNYGMANSVMERTIEQRRLIGLPGKAIQW